MAQLEGKVFVITGAASGIGAECARLFVAEGARVVIGDMNEEAGSKMAASLGEHGSFCACAVHKEDEVERLIHHAVTHFGTLDGLINNAGFGGVIGPIDETPADEWDLTHAVLVRGVFLGMKHAVRVMKPKRKGTIVNVASIAGVRAGYAPHAYASAKAAVIHLTSSVAMELAEQGIRVNCVSPGFIATPLTTQRPSGRAVDESEARAQLAAIHPLSRAGEPSDIAQALLYLSSDASSFVTGQNLMVDGGISAGRRWSEQPAYFHKTNRVRVHRPKDA